MIIDKHLYVGRMPGINVIKTIKNIQKFKLCPGVVLITLPLSGEGLLEVYHQPELTQPHYKQRSNDIHIVGIASSKIQAYSLVRAIIDDVYTATGGFDCVSYFRNYEKLKLGKTDRKDETEG